MKPNMASSGHDHAASEGVHMPSNADSSFAAAAGVVKSMMGKDMNPDEDLLVLEGRVRPAA